MNFIAKRALDIIGASAGLIVFAPLLALSSYLIARHDGGPALYLPERAGLNGKPFKMFKLRTMVKNADKSGVASTANDDQRITRLGKIIRRFKLDELLQLANVLRGDMSLVGPRPNLLREVAQYTESERQLLTVRPGITDISSIVFADEGAILEGKPDPDKSYNELIRPWKSRLGLFYISRQSLFVDLQIIALTVLTIISRDRALRGVSRLLSRLNADPALVRVALRKDELIPGSPP